MPYIRPTGAGVVGMQLLRAGALLLVHGVWVCVGATYIGVVLFVLTWAWVVLAGEGLGRTSVVRHTLEYTCLVTLVVQMYTNCVMGHAMFFVRAGGVARCALDTVQSTEGASQLARDAVCGLGAYELQPMRALYALEGADEQLFLQRAPGGGAYRQFSCRELGLSCFHWKMRLPGRGGVLPPALGMLRRIVLHDAAALFVAASPVANTARPLTRIEVPVPGSSGGVVLMYSPLRGGIPLVGVGVAGVSEVAALDTNVHADDVLVVVHAAVRRRAPFVGIALSRFCLPDTDTCTDGKYSNTYEFFRIARITQVHQWSLAAMVLACTDPLQNVCEVSLAVSTALLLANELFVLSLLLLLHRSRRGAHGHELRRALVNVVCIFSVNWLCLLAIAFPAQLYATRFRPYSSAIIVALLAQACYSVVELARVDFGAGDRYITGRPAHPSWPALLLQPALFYSGSVYVQALAFTPACVVYALCAVQWLPRGYIAVPTAADSTPRLLFGLR